ncbi:hypothetical protein N9L06_01085 [Mariniblastus sp.]|nr:hypothetical protein [Mariniblastus sp.]
MSPKSTTLKLLLPLLLICWSIFGSVAAAQEIRWKFSADDEFLVTQKQTTNMETLVEKRKSILGSSVELSAAWKVNSVEGDVALVDQTIESIKVNIDNPADNTKSVAIDTASDMRPAKNSRELLKQLQPLVGMVFQLKLNTRGEVLSVDVPDETKKRLDDIPTDSWLKALLDPGKLQGQIQSSSLPLPETELKKGQSVAIEPPANPATITAAPLGKRKMTYIGQKSTDGLELDVFSLSTVEKFDAAKAIPLGETATANQPDIATFEWDGKLRFDRESGHYVDCQQQTTITTSRSYRDMEITTSVLVESVFKLERK